MRTSWALVASNGRAFSLLKHFVMMNFYSEKRAQPLRVGAMLSLTLLLLSMAACSDSITDPDFDKPVQGAPEQVEAAPFDPGMHDDTYDCPPGVVSPSDCRNQADGGKSTMMGNAVSYLRGHSDSACRTLGDNAYYRYHNDNMFHDPHTTDYGYVTSNYPDRTYFGNPSFSNDELANTVAHEEMHHLDFGENDATIMGDHCGGGFQQDPTDDGPDDPPCIDCPGDRSGF